VCAEFPRLGLWQPELKRQHAVWVVVDVAGVVALLAGVVLAVFWLPAALCLLGGDHLQA
jgi:hypothetical protein